MAAAVVRPNAYGSGLYRSKDPIHNFKIRVRLERGPANGGIEPKEEEDVVVDRRSTSDHFEMYDLSRGNLRRNANTDVEEYVFSWQEKVFSQREMTKYADATQCLTDLEKKYHRQVKALRTKERPTKRLFSYVDNEPPPPVGEDVDDGWTEIRTRTTAVPPPQTMYIMADVDSRGQGAESGDDDHHHREVVLCAIKADARGTLTVTPDFSFGRNPYEIETGRLGRDVLRYTIEHASNLIGAEEKDQEAKIFQDFHRRRCAFLANQVGLEFQEPPKGIVQFQVFGEIESTEDFEYDGLYVNIFMELPKNWTSAEDDEPLSRATQTCTTKCFENKDVAYFSFPFEYRLLCPLEHLWNESSESIPRWPQLCFQVVSRDSWNRYRTEGYGHIALPSTSGSRRYRIETWRPIVPDLNCRLRRYFIGGSPELEDPSLSAVVPVVKGNCLGKYGLRTESSGTITVRLQMLRQCQEFASFEYRSKLNRLTDRLRSSGSLQASVDAVLEAFHKARQRMLAVRGDLGLQS